MKIKDMLKSIKKAVLTTAKIMLGISLSIGVFALFIWSGLKGILMFILGCIISIYLILSKNPVLISLIAMTDSEDFIDKLFEDKKDGR